MRDHRNGLTSAPRARPVLAHYQTRAGPGLGRRAIQDAHDDGVMTGFCYGLLAAGLAWLILSGSLVRLCVALVRATLSLDVPA
jgi:hypothetical protein